MDTTQVLLAILMAIIGWVLYWAHRKTKFFEERGIPFKKPLLFFGNTLDIFLLRKSSGQLLNETAQNEFSGVPIFGYFESLKPVVIVQDIELINRIFVKDFHHFVDHGFEIDEDKFPFDVNLFNMTGNRWRAFRNKFSPMFTSGKLKNMANEMVALSGSMVDIFEKRNLKKKVDLKESLCQLSMDIIGSCGYGLDTNLLGNENSEYRRMGKKVFKMDIKRFIRISIIFAFPRFARKLGISFSDKDVVKYFGGIVEETLRHRIKGGYQRNDFVQLMLTLKEKGSIEVTSRDASDDYLNLDSYENSSTEKFDFRHDQIVGHALSFLTLGFEATALTMLYLLYDLAHNQEFQDKLRQEINSVVEWKGGKLSYEAIKNMTYLDMCLKESQRIHTLGSEVFRVCTQEYTFPGTDFTILPGQSVKVPTQAVHFNPAVFPDPQRFDPERFAEDTRIPAGAFFPFGEGPRICIAMRFALLEVKIGVAQIIRRYRVTLNPESGPLKYDPMNFMPTPKEPLYFDLENVR